MTKYWIVVDKSHQGPFTVEELAERKISPDTYAWYPGLPKWTKAKDIPELDRILFASPVEEVVEAPVTETEPAAKTAEPTIETAPKTTPPPPPRRVVIEEPQVVNVSQPQEPATERPSSYLVWAIVTTVFFCLPLGIVSIIYSSKVSSQWQLGQYDAARKSSEYAAWFSNIAFVVGLIWAPFSILMTLFML